MFPPANAKFADSLRAMKSPRLFAIVLALFALTCNLRATTVTADSGNTSVDTTSWIGSLSVSMHRPTAAVLENTSLNSGIDEALRVKATNRALLGVQPGLPEWNAGQSSGLVADGVTPLLFRIARTDVPSAAGDTYELALQPADGASVNYAGSLQGLLQVAGAFVCTERTFITLSASQPEAFVVIRPVRPEDLQPNGLGEVRLRLAVKDAVSGLTKKSFLFALRRPPLVLVHGYNADENGWGAAFRTTVDDGRASEFLIRVGYGTANGNEGNIYGALLPLAGTLSDELRNQVEEVGGAEPVGVDALRCGGAQPRRSAAADAVLAKPAHWRGGYFDARLPGISEWGQPQSRTLPARGDDRLAARGLDARRDGGAVAESRDEIRHVSGGIV